MGCSIQTEVGHLIHQIDYTASVGSLAKDGSGTVEKPRTSRNVRPPKGLAIRTSFRFRDSGTRVEIFAHIPSGGF